MLSNKVDIRVLFLLFPIYPTIFSSNPPGVAEATGLGLFVFLFSILLCLSNVLAVALIPGALVS